MRQVESRNIEQGTDRGEVFDQLLVADNKIYRELVPSVEQRGDLGYGLIRVGRDP
jgi:hypothetical protein